MKAILLVDVPILDDGRHLCNECPIWNKDRYFCEYDFNMKAKGCSLRPLPEKSDYLPKDDHAYSKVEIMAYTYGIAVGRNEVIDEITGETE